MPSIVNILTFQCYITDTDTVKCAASLMVCLMLAYCLVNNLCMNNINIK